MKVAVVLTTITQDKEQTCIPDLEKWCQQYSWDLIVVGDKKTAPITLNYGFYMSPETQLSLGYKSASGLPWNCYARKNIGYLFALERGAEVIISTDDDNYPLENYHNLIDGLYHNTDNVLTGDHVFVNPLKFFSYEKPWPRGLPPYFANCGLLSKDRLRHEPVGVVAGLWNGAPDLDAIGHMLFGGEHYFATFATNKSVFKSLRHLAPYNTQNTAIIRELMPYQLLLPDLQRADDIWTSYISQTIMQMLDYGVLYISPTVEQKRNKHSLTKDLADEMKLMLKTRELVEVLNRAMTPETSPIAHYQTLIKLLVQRNILPKQANVHVENWLEDIENVIG